MYALGGLSGGIGAAVTGGNFWKGMGQGMIITGLNHAAHLTKSFFEKNILFGDKPAYRAMNRISEKTGNEVAAHEVEMETKGLFGRKIIKKGVLIYDYSDNEPHASSYPVKYDNNGKYITTFKGQTYEVKGLVHTHTTNIGVSDADIHAQRLFKNPIKMLFSRQVYELNIQQNRYVPTGVTY